MGDLFEVKGYSSIVQGQELAPGQFIKELPEINIAAESYTDRWTAEVLL